MSPKRLLGQGSSYYHVMSRVVDRRFALGEAEREVFQKMLQQHLAFAGIECLTYCLMSNHFHILVWVPDSGSQQLDDKAIVDRIRFLYPQKFAAKVEGTLRELRAAGRDGEAEEVAEGFVRRMHDLSVFMQELKSRFTRWFNQRHDRRGTLWEERFRSVLVEGSASALEIVSAYIDLNPVRAAIVDEARDYRHCGYAEAAGGGVRAQKGLGRALTAGHDDRTWSEVHDRYRKLLAGRLSVQPADGQRVGIGSAIDPTAVDLLKHRVGFFTNGLILGSQKFLTEVFNENRTGFGRSRSDRGVPISGQEAGGLCAMRGRK